MSPYFAVIKRDLLLSYRQGADLVMVLAFFLIASALFPLAVGPDPVILGRIASGIIWVLALLSVMLSLDRIFHNDYDDGALEQMEISPQSFYLIILAKIIAHWITTGIPLIILSPIIAIMLNLDNDAFITMILSLAIGTPILSLIGAIGAALSLGARRAGLLVAMLVLPLYIQILIFAISAIDASINNFPVRPHLLFLAAILAAALPLAPLAAAASIRQAFE